MCACETFVPWSGRTKSPSTGSMKTETVLSLPLESCLNIGRPSKKLPPSCSSDTESQDPSKKLLPHDGPGESTTVLLLDDYVAGNSSSQVSHGHDEPHFFQFYEKIDLSSSDSSLFDDEAYEDSDGCEEGDE